MLEDIRSNMENPRQLETLYRGNRANFKSAFNDLYPQVSGVPLAEGWYQRLNYAGQDTVWGTPGQRVFVVGASLVAMLLAQLPKLLILNEEVFYSRHIGFIVFPLLIVYFAWKNKISQRTGMVLGGFALLALVFINALPLNQSSNTLILSCIHLPLWLWSLLGFTFGGGRFKNGINWLGFLRYNGELAVMMALLALSGGLMTGLTFGLFELIGWHIQKFYFDYVVICGLAAVPVVATFLTQTQPALVNKVSPVIANLFSPVALVMLVVYLVATFFSGKSPYQDREFLLLYNALLIGVMALIFFSVAETTPTSKNAAQILILFLLSAVTVLVNGIALSAVLFRIVEGGITPNRAAVLGANVLMLSHLLYVAARLLGAITGKSDLALVGRSMAFFMPVYSLWSAVVTFIFPLLFWFR